jgi:hypothetical protein
MDRNSPVGDVQATIDGTLEGTEETGTSGGAAETGVEVRAEWAALVLLNVNRVSRPNHKAQGESARCTLRDQRSRFLQKGTKRKMAASRMSNLGLDVVDGTVWLVLSDIGLSKTDLGQELQTHRDRMFQ